MRSQLNKFEIVGVIVVMDLESVEVVDVHDYIFFLLGWRGVLAL